MNPFDVTPDDAPLDLTAVGADDALIESLRRSLSPEAAVVWDDDQEELDPGYALLRALQLDVIADLPSEPILPANVTPLVTRRGIGRGATVAILVAGVVSIGGVAAASAPGQPLAGVRSAVASALGSAVSALTPDVRAASGREPSEAPHPTGSAAAPQDPAEASSGTDVAAARPAAAAAQVDAELAAAQRALDRGQEAVARRLLTLAARKLPLVLDEVTHGALAKRLAALRDRLAAAGEPEPQPARTEGPGEDRSGDSADHGRPADGTSDGSDRTRGDSGTRATTGDGGNGDPGEVGHVGETPGHVDPDAPGPGADS